MKKRRFLIISLLLVAALALGIGYAALSRELIINSTASLTKDDADFNIVFTAANTDVDHTIANASVGDTGLTASYSILGLSTQGDDVTFTFTVENKTADVNAKLTDIVLTSGNLYIGTGTDKPGTVSDYFSKTVSFTDNEGNVFSKNDGAPDVILSPGETGTVTITVTLNKTLTENITLTGATVMLDFESVDATA